MLGTPQGGCVSGSDADHIQALQARRHGRGHVGPEHARRRRSCGNRRFGAMMALWTWETAVFARIMFALALVVASGAALSSMTECQSDCEKKYKSCATGRKMSESACRAEYEKCRKACAKKAGSPSPT
jgi:hypothetical protein